MLVPIDQLAEIIYSVLILLTFTQAYRLITRGATSAQFVSRDYANELVIAALGAIVAWGTIDGIMHVLLSVLERSERHQLLRTVQAAETDQAAVDIIAEEFDYMLEPIAGVQKRQLLYTAVLEQLRTSKPRQVGFKQSDWREALGLVLVAVVSVLPSLAPFVLLRDDFLLAIRISNTISFIILFLAGYAWGQYTGTNPWKTGLILALVGAFMVMIAFLLGG
jgi:VIT1/CCC1 family predicted Fe2+/Mn2+ transporter